MLSLLKNFFRSSPKVCRGSTRPAARRSLQSKLSLEALETRLMPAANLSLGAGSVLVLTETSRNAALTVTMPSAGTLQVALSGDTFTPPTNLPGLQLNAAHNLLTISNLSGYSKVEVVGGAGDAATLSSPSFGTGSTFQSGFSGGEGFDRVQGLGGYAGEVDMVNFPTVTFNSGNVKDVASLTSYTGRPRRSHRASTATARATTNCSPPGRTRSRR